jgi:hypothetical protein
MFTIESSNKNFVKFVKLNSNTFANVLKPSKQITKCKKEIASLKHQSFINFQLKQIKLGEASSHEKAS